MELSRIISSSVSRVVLPQALPPQVQEARERETIQTDPRLKKLLGDEQVVEIRKVEGVYVVITATREMQVDVHYLPPKEHCCGPAKFELFFHEPKDK